MGRILRMIVAILLPLSATVASAQTLKPNEVFSSISIRPLDEPNPVLGSDNRVHLAYEVLVINPSKVFMTIDRFEVIDPQGKSLLSLAGAALDRMIEPFSGMGRTIPPGGSMIIFLDVQLGADQALPQSLSTRISATRQIAGPDGKPTALPAGYPLEAQVVFTGASTGIGKPARVVEPPLHGSDWVVFNGCCGSITAHRGAIMAVNGVIRVPERFAIDWVQLNEQHKFFSGPASDLGSYHFYSAPIYSAADGVVVNRYDEAGEQVPGAAAKGITTADIGGNMLVVDIGGGAFAFYAHLQRGTLKAKIGDKVKTGDVLGLLGNTGNSDAPHLHFQLMDGPSPLNANSLPFIFSHFVSKGVLSEGDEDALSTGKAVTIDSSRLAGKHANQLPLNGEVVDFP